MKLSSHKCVVLLFSHETNETMPWIASNNELKRPFLTLQEVRFILIIVDGLDSCYPDQTLSYGAETWSGASVHSVADLLAPEQRGPELIVLQGRPVIRGADSRSVPWLIIQLGRHTFSRVSVRVDRTPWSSLHRRLACNLLSNTVRGPPDKPVGVSATFGILLEFLGYLLRTLVEIYVFCGVFVILLKYWHYERLKRFIAVIRVGW